MSKHEFIDKDTRKEFEQLKSSLQDLSEDISKQFHSLINDLKDYSDTTRRQMLSHFKHHPLKSVGIAAGIGGLIGLLMARRRKH